MAIALQDKEQLSQASMQMYNSMQQSFLSGSQHAPQHAMSDSEACELLLDHVVHVAAAAGNACLH